MVSHLTHLSRLIRETDISEYNLNIHVVYCIEYGLYKHWYGLYLTFKGWTSSKTQGQIQITNLIHWIPGSGILKTPWKLKNIYLVKQILNIGSSRESIKPWIRIFRKGNFNRKQENIRESKKDTHWRVSKIMKKIRL